MNQSDKVIDWDSNYREKKVRVDRRGEKRINEQAKGEEEKKKKIGPKERTKKKRLVMYWFALKKQPNSDVPKREVIIP